MKILRYLLPILFVMVATEASASSTRACNALARQKNYDLAAECFVRVVKGMKPGSQLNRLNQKLKSLYLQKASFSFRKAGDNAKDDVSKAYYLERGAQTLQQILDENLCQKKHRCLAVKGKQSDLIRRIQYSQLTLEVSPGTTIQLTITGFKFALTRPLSQTKTMRLRPGTYKVSWVLGANKQDQSVTLGPSESKILRAQAPITRRPPPPPKASSSGGAIALLSIGLLVTAGGVVQLALGYINAGDAAQLANAQTLARQESAIQDDFPGTSPDKTVQSGKIDTSTWQTSAADIKGKGQLGDTLIVTGWSTSGVGLALTLGGVIWLATNKPKASTPPPPNSKDSSSSLQRKLHIHP
ncbi:MAG: hypothetical protein EP343_24490 [Deltaproteobacteria bacterium]|nr:MAG: hypothetical protein EP343_24490 [Deltaproteobacteria bacterium]